MPDYDALLSEHHRRLLAATQAAKDQGVLALVDRAAAASTAIEHAVWATLIDRLCEAWPEHTARIEQIAISAIDHGREVGRAAFTAWQRGPQPPYVDGNRERAERIANLPVQRHPLPQNPALLRGVHVRVVAPGPFAGKTGVVKGTLPPRSRLRTGIDIAYGVDHDDRSQACWYGALDLEILDPDEPRRLSLALARRAYPTLAALPDDFDPCHDEAWQVADDPYRGEVLIGSDGRAYARG